MSTVTSKDGTTLVYDRTGEGPAIVLVSGASTTRATNAELASLLSEHLTVFNYDRRGRGDSGDTQPYALEREFEDLDAVIAEAGGSAAVLGFSSGAMLALKAAANGSSVTKLLLWEPPFSLDEDGPQRQEEYATTLAKFLGEGRRGDAAALFLNLVGLPDEMVAGMRQSPMWAGMEEVAPSLAYDAAAMGDSLVPTALIADLAVPTLVLDGGASPAFLRDAAAATVAAIPGAERQTLDGQEHNVAPASIAPVVTRFVTR